MFPATRAPGTRWTPRRFGGIHRVAMTGPSDLDYDVPFIPVARMVSPICVGMRGP